MRQHNRYDFDDMINWIIKAFEENKTCWPITRSVINIFWWMNTWDTSGTQNKLVQLLIEYWEQPNIFVVDDDQSIYRFQGECGEYAGVC